MSAGPWGGRVRARLREEYRVEYVINEIYRIYSWSFSRTYKNYSERLTAASFTKFNFGNVYHSNIIMHCTDH